MKGLGSPILMGKNMINRTPLKIDGSKQLVYKVIFKLIFK